MSALSSEVAGEAQATWPRQIRGSRSVWVEILLKTRRPAASSLHSWRVSPPASLSSSHAAAAAAAVVQITHSQNRTSPTPGGGGGVAVMWLWCRVTGGDDATGGVDRSARPFHPSRST